MGNSNKKLEPAQQDPSDKIFDAILEFKLMGKAMLKEAKKSENQSKVLIKKVKDCISKGEYEQAKITANDAIRQKNQLKRYRVLSSKIFSIAQRLESVYQNQSLTEKMQSLVKKLNNTGIMDLVQMNETMANFEKLFDDLDTNGAMMDKVFDAVSSNTVNEGEINQLIEQIAQQNGMKLSEDFDNIRIGEEEVVENNQQEQVSIGGFPMA